MLGKPCPMPVLEASKALAAPDRTGVTVLVDNTVATANLERLAANLGCAYACNSQGENHYRVTITKGDLSVPADAVLPEGKNMPALAAEGAAVLITSDQMGRGSEELGKILIKGFLFALAELSVPPKTLLFLNAGVKLAVEGANTLADLQVLAAKGVDILACGTCLNYYQLTDKLAVGQVTDMMGIASRLADADKVISL